MAMVLVLLGAVSVVAGAVMTAYGIPVKEFSLGNTLILAGVVATVGGLILVGIGLVIGELRRIADTLNMRPLQPVRPGDLPEAIGGRVPGRIPFPQKPKPELVTPGAPPIDAMDRSSPAGVSPDDAPDEPDDAPPSVRSPLFPSAPSGGAAHRSAPPPDTDIRPDASALPPFIPTVQPPLRPDAAPETVRPESERQTSWQKGLTEAPEPRGGFDAIWTGGANPAKAPAPAAPAQSSPASSDASGLKARDSDGGRATPRAAAILKSGIVDGMGYTLYVDGSIEAELPQGTVRFASIAELRAHLERNS